MRSNIANLNPTFPENTDSEKNIIEQTVEFGSYPQELASTEVSKHMELIPSQSEYGWSHLYRSTEENGTFVKIRATPYQPLFSSKCYQFHSNKKVISQKEYFFKIAPISWIVLKKTTEYALLLSEKVLDSRLFLDKQFVGSPRVDGYPNKYYENVDSAFPNSWKYSTLRAFLNGEHTFESAPNFLTLAFSPEEREKIKRHQNKNDIKESMINIEEATKYSWLFQTDTEDLVFCLSVAEAASFPFNPNPKATDKDICKTAAMCRAAEVTDFAIAKGVCPYDRKGKIYGWWWLRSPGDPSQHEVTLYNKSKAPICQKRACDVTDDGHICQRASIVCGSEEDFCDGSANGIRPAIYVSSSLIQ